MKAPVLSRAQRNQLFQLIRQHKLDPADFRWSTVAKGNEFTEIVAHPLTSSQFEFSHFSSGGWWLHWWPSQGQGRRSENVHRWERAVDCAVDWLTAVRADHDAPDLWGEVAKEKVISGTAERPEYLAPFSPAELKLLATGLADIERYIEATQPLDPAGKQKVRERFAYLLDAAKKGARKIDWLNIFVAQMVALVTAGLLDARVYGTVMAHAATVLSSVFQFGMKVLGSGN